MKHKFKNLVRGLLLLFFAQALLNSCSSEDKDEPALVGYYLALDSTEFIGITENDEANGTMAPPEDHNIFMTYLKMKKALRLSFPKALPQGNDSRAIAICDSCFRESMYITAHGNTICTARLIRTQQRGDHVISSKQLKFYRFSYF